MIKKTFILVFTVLIIFNMSAHAEEVTVPILMYHNINDNYDVKDVTVEMSAAEFKDQMQSILSDGYNPIDFQQYIDYVNNNKELPSKPIIITFDDGYLNNYTTAFPILKQLGMKATIFIITGRMGMQNGVKYPHFTWEQAEEMEKSGVIDIQSHTNFHNELDKIPYSSLVYEMRKSKFLIDKNLNKNTDILAYPYGYYNSSVMEAARMSGYKAAVLIDNKNHGVNTKNRYLYELKRITAYGGMSGAELIKSINDCKNN